MYVDLYIDSDHVLAMSDELTLTLTVDVLVLSDTLTLISGVFDWAISYSQPYSHCYSHCYSQRVFCRLG